MQFFRSKITFCIALLVLALFGFLAGKAYFRERKLENQISRLEKNIAQAESQNKELAQLVEYYSASEHLEKEARIRLNLKKPGEEVLVIPYDPPSPPPTTSVPIHSATGPFDRILHFFRSLYNEY